MRNKDLNIVGPKVRKLRKALALSQSALARICQLAGWDISREGIAKIELGIRGVSDKEVVKLSKALELNSSDILLSSDIQPEDMPIPKKRE